jgi:hypothetical protein
VFPPQQTNRWDKDNPMDRTRVPHHWQTIIFSQLFSQQSIWFYLKQKSHIAKRKLS